MKIKMRKFPGREIIKLFVEISTKVVIRIINVARIASSLRLVTDYL